ncbi:DUF2202 domain-containing protein [Chloroflexales bacterium ZM16-3]|nr:DUF2202 domain-containing protein [Chloroflexales bacterium ZM16-3]
MRRAIILSSLALGLALGACAAPATSTTAVPSAPAAAAASQPSASIGGGVAQGNQGGQGQGSQTPVGQGQGSQGNQGGQGQGGQTPVGQGQGNQGNQGQGGQGQGSQTPVGQGQGQGSQGQGSQAPVGQGQGQGGQGQGGQGQGGQGQGGQGQGGQGQGGQGQSQPTASTTILPSDLTETPCLICDADMSQYSGPLSADEVNGLLLSLNDEYHAWAVYNQVITDFGDVRPFASIIQSEAGHISSLETLFNVYGVPLPAENPWVGQAPSFASTSEACAAGVGAEIVNADLYARLFASTDRADILQVYEVLQSASLNNHLPAFQRCA